VARIETALNTKAYEKYPTPDFLVGELFHPAGYVFAGVPKEDFNKDIVRVLNLGRFLGTIEYIRDVNNNITRVVFADDPEGEEEVLTQIVRSRMGMGAH